MKVLMVIDRMIIGGAEQVYEDIIHLLNEEIELKALLLIPTDSDQLNRVSKYVETYQLNRKNKWSFYKLYQCKNIIQDFDIIHVHLRHTLRYILLVKWLFRLKNKVVFHDHYGSIDIDQNPPFIFYKFLKPNYYIGVCSKLTEWAYSTWDIPSSYSSTLINLPQKIGDIRNSMTGFKGDFVIVGNIKTIKNQKFAIKFTESINAHILIFGRNQDNDYYTQLKSFGNIEIIQNESNPAQYFQHFKFGLCTSISESGPLVILEYFIKGLPFLSHKTGGIADALYKYVPQYFLNTLDLNDWIKRYHELNENYQRIPQSLIDEVLEKEFSSEKYMRDLLSIYEKCLDQNF